MKPPPTIRHSPVSIHGFKIAGAVQCRWWHVPSLGNCGATPSTSPLQCEWSTNLQENLSNRKAHKRTKGWSYMPHGDMSFTLHLTFPRRLGFPDPGSWHLPASWRAQAIRVWSHALHRGILTFGDVGIGDVMGDTLWLHGWWWWWWWWNLLDFTPDATITVQFQERQELHI